MKAVKGFVNTCYSEVMVSLDDSKDGPATKSDEHTESMYLGGLGLKFKFPGDPKKYVHRSFQFLLILIVP